jgi:hypothetical protein
MTDDGGMMNDICKKMAERNKEQKRRTGCRGRRKRNLCACRLGGVTAKSLNALVSVVDLRACAGLMGWGGAETNGFRFLQIPT